MIQRSLLTVAMAAVLLAPVAAYAQQTPTLGEIAAREQARRQALKAAPGKVLTKEDLPRTAGPAPVTAPSPAEVKPAEKGQEPPKSEDPPKDEAWWKARISQVREELRRNEMFAEALQTRINSLTNDFTARDDPYQRARIAEDRAKAALEMDRVKADVALNRKKIAEIEEEGRKAGAPPGWLR
ncbi:MAG: hypothetical protein H0W08_12440 [Acidobacteria bacterium]|nr:hypothetical protein [Acidobacteriota bacterium]